MWGAAADTETFQAWERELIPIQYKYEQTNFGHKTAHSFKAVTMTYTSQSLPREVEQTEAAEANGIILAGSFEILQILESDLCVDVIITLQPR